MGSRILSADEAAKMLGIHQRTIYNWTKKGFLGTDKVDGQFVISEDEVLRVKKIKENPPPFQITKVVVTKMWEELQILKSQMRAVMRILNIKNTPLKLTDPEVENFYKMTNMYLEEGNWPPHIEETWADSFVRFDMELLEQVQKITSDPHPWRPFFLLASLMCLKPYKEEAKLQLDIGRDHLHSLGYVWSQAHGHPPQASEMLLKTTEVSKKMLNKVDSQRTPII